MSLKSCNIVYGYQEHCSFIKSPNNHILLIEPRGEIIDLLKQKNLDKNIILISKILSEKDTMTDSILYFNKDEDKYFTKNDKNLLVRGTNYFNVKKYNVFTTSINNIILQYNIQNIDSLVININVENCNDILDSLIPFNHIISNIVINDNVNIDLEKCKILENFKTNEDSPTFTEGIRRQDNVKSFSHKNLNIKLPNIGMFFNGKLKNNKEITLLVQQYKMNLIIIKKKDSYIVPYPESITILNNNQDNTYSKIYHENIIHNLDCIFNFNAQNDKNEDNRLIKSEEIAVGDLEIIIQFNTKYFDNNKTLQIMYPLKDNVLYVNKVYDIIYGTKNCIYMLYQIIKSKYFSDFLEEKNTSRPKLFTIFSKIYFFEYISKIFVLKEF
jgi:hypothetical protein